MNYQPNETATDAAFISPLFQDVWGYDLQGKGPDGYQCYQAMNALVYRLYGLLEVKIQMVALDGVK